jgi:transcriptional regulator with PAS, ATPase and Fis domain
MARMTPQILSFQLTGALAAPAAAPHFDRESAFHGIVGQSGALRQVLERMQRVAPTEASVLITGETGTGKELLARAIHQHSRRAARQLVTVNMAAVPEGLAAAELFGHERGAYTGADRARSGRFDLADRGTLFLDEIGELRPDVQVMLLRVLQEGEFERLGSTVSRRVDVRLIAATNRDVETEVAEGRFRQDLFYRLNVFPIHMPSLRERADDIPLLAGYFLRQTAERFQRPIHGIERASMRRLQEYAWPGNIRQLQNVIERSVIMSDDGELVVAASSMPDSTESGHGLADVELFAGNPTLEEIKKRYVNHLLTVTHGNMARAAAMLDVDRRSLYRMVERYQLGSPAMWRADE